MNAITPTIESGRERAAAYFATASREEIVAGALAHCDVIDRLVAYAGDLERHNDGLRRLLLALERLARQKDDFGALLHGLVVKVSKLFDDGEADEGLEIIKAIVAEAYVKAPRPLVEPVDLIPPARVHVGAGHVGRQ